MSLEVERNNWSIVLVGSFNPAIFHPAWLLLNDIISQETFETADVQIVHPEVAKFSLASIRIDVQRNRFSIQTELAPEISILDYVLKVFGDLLPHSQITQFGVNRSAHFRTTTTEQRIKLGRKFAPTSPWGSFGKRIEMSDGDTIGGMTTVTMREVLTDNNWFGHIDANLAPSYDLNLLTGVQVNINNHFELKNYGVGEGAMRALELLRDNFEVRLADSEMIIETVMRGAE